MSKSLWGMAIVARRAGCSSDEGPTFALPFCTGSGARLNWRWDRATSSIPLSRATRRCSSESTVRRWNTCSFLFRRAPPRTIPATHATRSDRRRRPCRSHRRCHDTLATSPAEEFHLFLRRAERDRVYPVPPQPNLAPQAQPSAPGAAGCRYPHARRLGHHPVVQGLRRPQMRQRADRAGRPH